MCYGNMKNCSYLLYIIHLVLSTIMLIWDAIYVTWTDLIIATYVQKSWKWFILVNQGWFIPEVKNIPSAENKMSNTNVTCRPTIHRGILRATSTSFLAVNFVLFLRIYSQNKMFYNQQFIQTVELFKTFIMLLLNSESHDIYKSYNYIFCAL